MIAADSRMSYLDLFRSNLDLLGQFDQFVSFHMHLHMLYNISICTYCCRSLCQTTLQHVSGTYTFDLQCPTIQVTGNADAHIQTYWDVLLQSPWHLRYLVLFWRPRVICLKFFWGLWPPAMAPQGFMQPVARAIWGWCSSFSKATGMAGNG